MMNLQAQVSSFLEKTGMSSNALAREAGVSGMTISLITRGLSRDIRLSTLEKIQSAMFRLGGIAKGEAMKRNETQCNAVKRNETQ